MKSFRPSFYALFAGLTTWAAACSPIAPSVHKSVLRPVDPQAVAPGTAAGSTSATDAAPEDYKGLPIEVRWVTEDSVLVQELEPRSNQVLVRVASESITKLKSEGELRVELPEVQGKSIRRIRLVIRVQMGAERLEKALAAEPFVFGTDKESKVLTISRTDDGSQKAPSVVPGAVQDALVSAHLLIRVR